MKVNWCIDPRTKVSRKLLSLISDVEIVLTGEVKKGSYGSLQIMNKTGNTYNLTLPTGHYLQKYLPHVIEVAPNDVYEFTFNSFIGKVFWWYNKFNEIIYIGESVDTSSWNTSTSNWLDQSHIDLSIVDSKFRITRNSEVANITQLNSARSFNFVEFGLWRCEASFHNTSPYNDCEAILSIQENGETVISTTPINILSGNNAVVTLDVDIRNDISNAIFSIKIQRASAFDYFSHNDYVEFDGFKIEQIAD